MPDDAVCCAHVRRTANRLVPIARTRFDCQAANTTEQYASQPVRRILCHHSTRYWSGRQIRQRCSGGRESRPTADRNRCSETTQPPTCCDASPVPLVRDAHAASFETGQTRYAFTYDPRRWARHRVSHCCHCQRREAVPKWPTICGMVRFDTLELIQRRKGKIRADNQTGRSILANIAHPRCARCAWKGCRENRCAKPVDWTYARTAAPRSRGVVQLITTAIGRH